VRAVTASNLSELRAGPLESTRTTDRRGNRRLVSIIASLRLWALWTM